MKKKKIGLAVKFLKVMLMAVLAVSMALSVPVPMTAYAASGSIGVGKKATYTYDNSSRVFTLTGNFVGEEGAFGWTYYDLYSPFDEVAGGAVKAVIKDCKLSGNTQGLFGRMCYLQEVQFINVDTSSVTDLLQMFNGCSSLRTLDLSGLNTSNVRSIERLFCNCTSLQTVNLSGWVINGGTNVSNVFYGCTPATIYAPKTIGTTIPLNATYYDSQGTAYTTLSSQNAGKVLTTARPNVANQALTGTVTVSGTAKYNQTLTASVSNSNNSGTLSYQWKRGSNNVSGATSKTYKLTQADIGQTISCVVKSSVQTGSITGKTATTVAKSDGPAAPSGLSATGTTQQGKADGKITGTTTAMEYSTASNFSTKTKCSGSSITGLKAGTYYVRVAETATVKAGATASVVVSDGPALLTGTVVITGTVKYGQTLTVNVSNSNNSGTLTYQWQRGSTSISGATAQSYRLTESDIGKQIRCVIKSSKQVGNLISNSTAAVAKADGPAAPAWLYTVAASGKDKADGKITGTSNTMEYSTSASFTTKTTCSGGEVTGLKPGTYYVRVAETATTKAGAYVAVKVTDSVNALSGTVVISGTAKSGETLTASLINSNNDGVLSYQWMRGTTKISGATSNTYKVTSADLGLAIKCVVTSSTKTGSITGTVSGKVALTAPVTSYKNTTEGVQISWNAVSGAEGYYIYRKAGSGSYVKLATLSASTKTYVDKKANLWTAYTYAVKAYSGTLESAMAETAFTAKPVVDSSIKVPSFQVKGVIGGRTVTFNTEQVGGVVYYSKTTSMLTTADSKVSRGGNVTFTNYYGTIYARTYYNGKWSNVARLILKIPVVNKPTITNNGGGYYTITTTTPSCSVIYTTDGSTPSLTNGKKVNASSTKVYVGSGKTIKAMAVRSCFTNSDIATYK